MRAVVVRASTSSWISQPTPSADSVECSAPGAEGRRGWTPVSTGSTSGASWTVSVTGAGGATVLGQSAPATLTRSIWPGDHA